MFNLRDFPESPVWLLEGATQRMLG